MQKKKSIGLSLNKNVISKLQARQIQGRGGKGGGNTGISRCQDCGQAPSQRPSCNDE